MIRWKVAAPRLLLAASILLVIYVALNPLIKWAVESFGEQVLSVRVDVGTLDTSLAKTELRISDFAVADPKDPNVDLLSANEVTLSLDSNALLRRKFVVREGHVRGLKVRSQRDDAAEPVDHWQWNPDGDRLKEEADQWLAALSSTLGDQLEAEVEALESVQMAKELLESWPEEYRQLEQRVQDVKARVEKLRSLFDSHPKDVAASLQNFQKTLAELEQLQHEMKGLAEQIDALPERVESDRKALLAATQRDVEHLEERFESLRLDQETITGYFLGPEMGRQVVTIAEWVRWIRSHLPEEQPLFNPRRLPGTNVLFAGQNPTPDFLIRSLLIDGQTTIGGEPYYFVASAADLTTAPKLYGRPSEIRAQFVGNLTFEVHALLDRTGETPLDQIVIDCPNLALPETSLGSRDAVALTLQPGNTHLWIGLNLSGNQIAGTMLLKQSGVDMTPQVAESLGRQRLADNLALATEALDEIEVQVDLQGVLQHPKWTVRSNLGEKLVDGLNQAATAELEYRKNQAAQLVQERIDRELNKFRNRLGADEEVLMARLKLNESELDQIGKLIAQRVPSADKILTKALGDRIRLRF